VNASRVLILISISALLSACGATRAAYEERLNVYIGKPIDAVMEQGNIPTREYRMPSSGNKIYCFNARSFMTIPMMITPTQSISTVQGKNIYTTTYGGTVMGGGTVSLWCNTCFVTNGNNIILRYHLEGNHCVANPPDKD
jgi:hypothetical protein